MRVISGQLGGLNFDSPHGHRTHPMSEKMRGAIFSALGDIEGLSVLDVYAGSGALAIEALSRGADHAIAIDSDKKAAMTIMLNAKKLSLNTRLKVTQAHFSSWSSRNSNLKFDLVLADPPYDAISAAEIASLPLNLDDQGILVLSWPGKSEQPEFAGLKVVSQKDYGDSQLVFYKKIV